MNEKSILEQALLQVQNLEEAVKQNAKGILASTMKQELSDLLKESMEEEDETEVPVAEQPEDEVTPDEEEDDMSDEDAEADDAEADDTENDTNLDKDETTDMEDEEDETEVDTDVDTDVDAEDTSMDDFGTEDETSDEDVMDMTSASDDEVLKVFKAMKPEDGIVVKKDGNNVEFGDGEDEYIIKLDGEETPDVDESFGEDMSMGDEFSTEDESLDGMSNDEDITSTDDEETIYEIELDEEDEVEEPKKVEATEAARTKSNVHGNKNGMNRAGLPSKTKYKAGSSINEEVETLKKQNAEYKKALVLFKDKLNEVAVFNANLAYATRLFTEHSTTKQEKLNILKRFDTVSTMNEAKSLFSTIKTELGSKTTVTESVAKKISNTPSTSSSTEVLSESKAYENPQFSRIKEMMRKIK